MDTTDNHITDNFFIQNTPKDSLRDFDRLFHIYYPRIKAYVSSILNDNNVEDITQEVFIYIWENRKKLYAGNKFGSYLFQTAYTKCLDYLRQKQRFEKYASVQLELAEEHQKFIMGDCPEIINLYKQNFFEILEKLLNELPPQRKEAFELAYLKGLKTKEIAEQLQIPPRTVESHLYLTIKFLKSRFPKDPILIWYLSLLFHN